MSLIAEIHRDREDLARVLKKHKGIRRTVEDLYPDKAHFIYELLQNAEDTGATEASFLLSPTNLIFEHDGRPFTEKDIWAITDIGEGTKAEDTDKIGRFGVGFKAVFAYSETPRIYSPSYSFSISDFVLPTEIPPIRDLGGKTRFEFPFNNPKKADQEAYSEVQMGLEQLAETTLLFLSHLKSIAWKIDQQPLGQVQRKPHTENHIEVLKLSGDRILSSSHFLRFSNPVEGLPKQHVSVAFPLDHLPGINSLDHAKPLAKQLKVVPALPGRVSVFFPAEKETSGLRFHLHAPFVTPLDRASVKDTPSNDPLFEQIARLAAQSLHRICKLGLLSSEFLGVLPHPQDSLGENYETIRKAIVDEMNNEPLTPTHHKTHAPAQHLLQAKAVLKDFLSLEDIEFLVDYKDVAPQWAIGATQKNSDIDKFLNGLEIKNWDVDKFIQLLSEKCHVGPRYLSSSPWVVHGSDAQFMKWLDAKSAEWHQQMYALLYTEIQSRSEYQRSFGFSNLKSLQLIRLSSGKHTNGKCYFPSENVVEDDFLVRVDKNVYSSGKNKTQQQEAKAFLQAIGVTEIGEAEQVEIIVRQRYSLEAEIPDEKTYLSDLNRFIALVENEPAKASLFRDAYIFHLVSDKWGTPEMVFLDSPFGDTGLSAYYGALGDKAERTSLNLSYQELNLPIAKFQKFAAAVGAQTELRVKEVSCRGNPRWEYLRSVPGERYTSPTDSDYEVPFLNQLLANPSVALSKLVWRTMCGLETWMLEARYKKNDANGSHRADSQLVHLLKTTAWVPQTTGAFVRPALASRDLLPEGFPFDLGDEWLNSVEFGNEVEEQASQAAKQQTEQESAAKALGFGDVATLDRAKQFAALPLAEQERILAEFQKRQQSPPPQNEPKNPQRRAEKLAEQAEEAPERIVEKKVRSVSVGREDVKRETEQYLAQQYTNELGELFCQICWTPLPFKLDDGGYYFEKVEFLAELKRRHLRNYLCLCPNHSAMFQHANGSKNVLKNLFLAMDGDCMEIVLAQQNATVYFTKTHVADLKTVIEVDAKEASPVSRSDRETAE